jgi:hypothetical protein
MMSRAVEALELVVEQLAAFAVVDLVADEFAALAVASACWVCGNEQHLTRSVFVM